MEQNCLTDDAKEYLARFHEILEEMINSMTAPKSTCSISLDFIERMIPHHRAAIEMCENILKYTECEPLCAIAKNIICEQTKSIENLEKVKECCAKKKNTNIDVCRYEKKTECIMENMFSKMGNACKGNCIDQDFILEMIPHHLGAIEMSENAMRFDICPRLRPILRDIIYSQRKGVNQMRSLLKNMK